MSTSPPLAVFAIASAAAFVIAADDLLDAAREDGLFQSYGKAKTYKRPPGFSGPRTSPPAAKMATYCFPFFPW
jgi:hypothetical protein